jgi:hypothetical protein
MTMACNHHRVSLQRHAKQSTTTPNLQSLKLKNTFHNNDICHCPFCLKKHKFNASNCLIATGNDYISAAKAIGDIEGGIEIDAHGGRGGCNYCS